MSDEDLNARPESIDEGWHPEKRYGGGVSAGSVVNWLVLVLVLVAVGYLAYGAAQDFFPRWWAEQVGMEVVADSTRGMIFGLGIGAVFTFVPLLLFAQARRRVFSWAWRFIIALLAVALALPNWLTVAVAIGTSRAAQDGRIIMTAEAPGFRNGSAIGAIVGGVLGLIVVGTSMRLSQQRKRVRELKYKVSDLERRTFTDASDSDEPGQEPLPKAPDAD
jgi:gas vesicle protein